MKMIDCPRIGPRPVAEFQYGGAWRPMPNPNQCGDSEWAHYVFHRDGGPGVKREFWYHVPSATWLVAERDTLRDCFLRTLSLADVLAEEIADA